jgi:hypothetical protein
MSFQLSSSKRLSDYGERCTVPDILTEQLQVILKLKSKHIGGALSKNKKSKYISDVIQQCGQDI